MNKALVSFCMAGTLLGLASCASTKNAVTIDAISGAWNIIEIEGSAVVPAPGQKFPYIIFDTTSGQVAGNAGCNAIVGRFDVNAKAGTIDLGALGTTRMMCPDMSVENKVLAALHQVKKYKKLGDENVALLASSKHPVIVLQKRKADVTLTDLEGRWLIREAGGVAIPDSMENQPFVEFNVAEKRVHGNAGCNVINGSITSDESDVPSIAFSQMISTMMACPDMETEGRVLKALNDVRSFARLNGGGIGFYDANGTLVLVVQKTIKD